VFVGWVCSPTQDLAAKSAAWFEIYGQVPKDLADYDDVVSFSRAVIRLVESGSLKSAEDFYRAGQLARIGYGEFKSSAVAYECFLTATAKGSRAAARMLPLAWDELMVSISRPMRMDFDQRSERERDKVLFEVVQAPAVIRSIWANAEGATGKAAGSEDNREIVVLEEADQRVRQTSPSDLSAEQLRIMRDEDRVRNARVREIVNAGNLTTPADFARAALVLQHGSHFSSFQLAHELAVCALLLGDQELGRWLVAATYDRTLTSLGHRQRFGTQHEMDGQTADHDASGICLEQRRTFLVVPRP